MVRRSCSQVWGYDFLGCWGTIINGFMFVVLVVVGFAGGVVLVVEGVTRDIVREMVDVMV